MDRPAVGQMAEALYEALGPFAAGDEEREWPLLLFCDAICDALLERIDVLVRDRDEYPGWVIALDPLAAPLDALPWLAQFAGVTLEPELTEAEQRAKIASPEGFQRGTPAAMREAGKRTLTGTKTVLIEERYTTAYALWVRTLATETPDPVATEAAIRSQKPIGLVLTYESVTGQGWNDLKLRHANWDAVEVAYENWDDVRSTPP